MTREELLQQEYEEVTLKILMDYVAQAQGRLALEENQRLQQDPEAAVPEALQRRVEETIRKAFGQQKKAHRSLRKALKIAAIAAILLAMMGTVVFAVSPTVRADVITSIMNVYDTYTDFSFEEGTVPHEPAPPELDINLNWLPDGFGITQDGSNGDYTWKRYEKEGTIIKVSKSLPLSYGVDTEDAVVTPITIQGYEATLIEKNNEHYVLWLDTEDNIVCFVYTDGVSLETMLKVAENLS